MESTNDQSAEQSKSSGRRPAMSPDAAFQRTINRLLQDLSIRQSDLLRISEYLKERESELDNSRDRLAKKIEQRLGTVDLGLVDEAISVRSNIRDELRSSTPEDGRATTERLTEAFLESTDEISTSEKFAYLDTVFLYSGATIGSSHLHSSLLLILISELEIFIDKVARACFKHTPESLDQKSLPMSWAEISQFESIDDIRNDLVDRKIETLLRGSLEDWVSFFEDRFRIPKIEAARSRHAVEAMQRRHCIAHYSGRASKQYLDKMSELGTDKRKGESLDVNLEYLRDAADAVLHVAFSLTWGLSVKFIRDEAVLDRSIGMFSNQIFRLLEDGRYKLVKAVGDSIPYGTLKSEKSQGYGFTMKVNRWIAYKELQEFSKVRESVEGLPVGNMADRYKLAKHSLLSENEKAYHVAQRMISNNDLSKYEWLSWPLLRGVRDFAESRELSPFVQ